MIPLLRLVKMKNFTRPNDRSSNEIVKLDVVIYILRNRNGLCNNKNVIVINVPIDSINV